MLREIRQQVEAAKGFMATGNTADALERLNQAKKLLPHLTNTQRDEGQSLHDEIIELENGPPKPRAA